MSAHRPLGTVPTGGWASFTNTRAWFWSHYANPRLPEPAIYCTPYIFRTLPSFQSNEKVITHKVTFLSSQRLLTPTRTHTHTYVSPPGLHRSRGVTCRKSCHPPPKKAPYPFSRNSNYRTHPTSVVVRFSRASQ